MMSARSPLVRLRRSISVLALVGLLSLLSPGSAGALVTGIAGGNLTSDAFNQDNPSIWRGIVAWTDRSVEPVGGDIIGYDWNADQPLVICTNPATQTLPSVGDEYVVWQDYRNGATDIYAWNMVTDTEVPICTNLSSQAAPDIYQRYIVWHDLRNGSWDIYGYDLVDDVEFPVYVADGPQTSPKIWGDVVVFQDFSTGTNQIAMHDISTGVTTVIAPGPNPQYYPDICQEWIVWTEDFGSSDGIRQYNLSSGEVVTSYDAPGDQVTPTLDGDWLLFNDQESDSGDIGFTDMLQHTLSDVFPDTGATRSPVMSHGTAVYVLNNGDDDIMIAEPTWTHDTQELAGDNRYATAGLIAEEAWRFGSSDVVIATGANFPDALGAAALAGQLNAPLVLTDGAHLSPEAADALLTLGVDDEITIVGGPAAVSDTVIAEIQALLPPTPAMISRVSGDDRYETAAAVADYVASLGGVQEPYGFVCTGLNYPDALAASSMAYALGIPVYLVQGESVPQSLIDQMLMNGVTLPIIVGGTGAVSQAIEDQLLAEPGFEDVWRVWGLNRYETAAELASFSQGVFEFGASGVCVATGQSFPDALAGGQLAGNRYAPLLLTESASLSAATEDWFFDNAELESIRSVTFLGGDVAITPAVRTSVSALLH